MLSKENLMSFLYTIAAVAAVAAFQRHVMKIPVVGTYLPE
jgi:hypothetical protein